MHASYAWCVPGESIRNLFSMLFPRELTVFFLAAVIRWLSLYGRQLQSPAANAVAKTNAERHGYRRTSIRLEWISASEGERSKPLLMRWRSKCVHLVRLDCEEVRGMGYGDGSARAYSERKGGSRPCLKKPKVTFYWCASCGGCEESVVDLAENILDVVAAVDIVMWPVAMDFKKKMSKLWKTIDFSFNDQWSHTDIWTGRDGEAHEKEEPACNCVRVMRSFGRIPGLPINFREKKFFNIYLRNLHRQWIRKKHGRNVKLWQTEMLSRFRIL